MNNFTKYIFVIAVLLAFAPQFVFAHQPRIVKSNFVIINNPEVSQAFYGELKGTSTEFQIVSEKDFVLYTGILVPDIPNVKKDISVNIYMIDGTNKELVATLDGGKFDWAPYYEGFAKDNYFWGPEFKALNSSKDTGLVGQPMKGGDYRIVVYLSLIHISEPTRPY